MPPIVSSFEITRPPDGVYSYLTDPARFPEWQDDVVRVRIQGGRPPSVGATFTTTRRIGRVEQTTTQEITEITPPSTWTARSVDGPLRPSTHVTVEPLGDGARSRVTIALDFEGHGIGRLLPLEVIRRMAAKGAPKSYQNLKERLERGAWRNPPVAVRSRSRRSPLPGFLALSPANLASSAAPSRSRAIAYWVSTGLVAAELGLGGVWDVWRTPRVRGVVVERLGYPSYFLVILGVGKLPGAVALLAPRFPRLKEWAYAGAVFTYTGAVASHLAAGDVDAGALVFLIAMTGLTAASWALRPPARRDLAPR